MNSYVINSTIVGRDDGDPIFVQMPNGDVLARLDGFLVVPKDKVPDLDAFLLSIGGDAYPSAFPV